jgi:hypothetical protein
MSDDSNIFFDEWRACLRAHFIHVIRTGDTVTEPTLRHVLMQTGLTEADLDALTDQARALGPPDPDRPFAPPGAAETGTERADDPDADSGQITMF